MKTCFLIDLSGNCDEASIGRAAASVGRRIAAVIKEPPADLFAALLNGESDLIIFGSPVGEYAEIYEKSPYKPINGIFFGKRLIVEIKENEENPTQKAVSKIKDALGLDKAEIAFKLFGERADRLDSFILSEKRINPDIDIFYSEDNCDITCVFLLKKGYSPARLDACMKSFLNEFKSSVYADENVDLFERFVSVMKLYGRKMSVAESMTGGTIASKIVSIKGASEIFYEGLVTYDTRAKFRRLGVLPETVAKNTVVSAEVAYEMVRSLIGDRSSVGVSVTGYAPSVSKNKNDGLCFIGAAVDDRTKVYRFVFSGDRKTVIEKAARAAVFAALKLLTESFFEN